MDWGREILAAIAGYESTTFRAIEDSTLIEGF